jgi:hypothetical protein
MVVRSQVARDYVRGDTVDHDVHVHHEMKAATT